MKLNALERIVVETPLRRFWQLQAIRWMVPPAMTAPARMLEIGCGTGHALGWIQRHFRPRQLTAVDLDMRMLMAAAGRRKIPCHDPIALACADASRLPFGGDVFDAVVGFGFLHHVPHWQKALAEVARILRPGGLYFIEEFYPALYQNRLTRHLLRHPEENRFDSSDLHAALMSNAFTLEAIFEWRPFYVLAVARRGTAEATTR